MKNMKKMADGGLTDMGSDMGANAATGIDKISEGAQALGSSLNQINQAVGTSAPGFQAMTTLSPSPAGSLGRQLGYKKGGSIKSKASTGESRSKKSPCW